MPSASIFPLKERPNPEKSTICLYEEARIIRKKVHHSKIQLEVEMTEKAFQLGTTSGLFRVPRVVGVDLKSGWIDFEYINNLKPLQEIIFEDNKRLLVVEKAGKCLAYIHNNLFCNTENRCSLPGEIEWPDTKRHYCFIHGDFNLQNVKIESENNQMVILDWSLSPLFKQSANWGTPYWDLFWFINAIFVTAPFGIGKRPNCRLLANAFLQSYNKNMKPPLVISDFSAYCLKSFSVALRNARRYLPRHSYLYQLPRRYSFYYYIKKISKNQN